MNSKKRLLFLILILVGLAGFGVLLLPAPEYRYEAPGPLPATFEDFQKQMAPAAPVREGNEDRVVRFSPERTEYAILYIHGFGASRGEGELVVDKIAERFRANTYYMRLPGHGTNKDDLREQGARDYLDAVEAALRAMPLLGKRTVVMGTSFGGLLATHLAAAHPDGIAGLVLVSPFYEFAPLDAKIMGHVLVRPFARLALGHRVRVTRPDPNAPPDKNDARKPGYERFWYNEKYTDSYFPIAELRDGIVRQDRFARITMPVLLLYYYRDEEHQDASVSVREMLERFTQMGRSPTGRGPLAGHRLNRAVAIEDGNHVMLSEWVQSDNDRPRREIEDFLNAVMTDQGIALPEAAAGVK